MKKLILLTLLFVLPLVPALPAVSSSDWIAAVRSGIADLYRLQGTRTSREVTKTLPSLARAGETVEVPVTVEAFFDNRNRLRRISWCAYPGVASFYYYDKWGYLMYSYGYRVDPVTLPNGNPDMLTCHYNAYWKGSSLVRAYAWTQTTPRPGRPGGKRARATFRKGPFWYPNAAAALKAAGAPWGKREKVRFRYVHGIDTMANAMINACQVSRRSRPSLTAPRQGFFDAGEQIKIKKTGPALYIRGLGTFHWYLVHTPMHADNLEWWIFGAFIEPMLVTLP